MRIMDLKDRDLEAHYLRGRVVAQEQQYNKDRFMGAIPSAAEAYGITIKEVYARPRPLPVVAFIEGYLDALGA